ncbi:unnamed protein product [Caenorhabditis angaria]|uniref:Extracellular Endonuclease subunit A domain-containing protein n=1 Tax=Caenorhabditis angaria TaxID=860376 RepID=A0A9P1NA18_9PELO|nr:unnamed protein product [Caenorhabditis angaria]
MPIEIDEKTPMISRGAVSSSFDANAIHTDEVDETKSWFSRRFCVLICISIVTIVMAATSLILIFVLISQMKAASLSSNGAVRQQFEQLAKTLREPLDKLYPALQKMQTQTQTLTQLPRPDGVNPINPIIIDKKTMTEPEPIRRSEPARHEWKNCEEHQKCELDGFEKPPLVILSLDGFAREYLDRNVVQTFNHIAKCGVKAEHVYPSYPSKTFPNHYTIVTGLYPESHGIIDNSVFDPEISPNFESMKKTTFGEFYGGEPIWSFYKRKTGKPANCLFWVGCYYNQTGYKPDIAPAYNGDLPFRNRIDKVVSWLKEPENVRAGLITAYLHEPDNAGHYQINEDDIDRKLAELDDMLDYMMSELAANKLLGCINLVILSDHGMQVLEETKYFEDYLRNSKDVIGASGVVGRIVLNLTSSTGNQERVSEILEDFTCKIEDVKVNSRSDMPYRKHYSKSRRIGEVVMEGKPGITFYNKKSDDYHLSGDHGYDYFHNKMHTIFFAQGPNFKKNVTIRPYQNVEYMNLWMELLGFAEEEFLETNGTVGVFDDVLVKTSERRNFGELFGECAISGVPNVIDCQGTSKNLQELSSKLLSCQFAPHNLPIFSKPGNEHNYCQQNFCDNNLLISEENLILTEVLRGLPDSEAKNQMEAFIGSGKYANSCPKTLGNVSLAVDQTREFSNIAKIFLDLPRYFEEKILSPLQNLTLKYLANFSKLFVITGISNNSTNFYRIILACENGIFLSENPPTCDNFENTKIISFIFPIISKPNTWDCMTSEEILTDHISTIIDIERIAGFKFQNPGYSPNLNIKLRTNITTRLW